MQPRDEEMKCPSCHRFGLRETSHGADCKVCGYQLSPGEAAKFRLFKLVREEGRKK
jgi:ribosomal protein L37AE/L43A